MEEYRNLNKRGDTRRGKRDNHILREEEGEEEDEN